jgi:hypothetical protein
MPHIGLPQGLPGITSAFAFHPETVKPMRELAEILLSGPRTLTSGERKIIATFDAMGVRMTWQGYMAPAGSGSGTEGAQSYVRKENK